MTLEFKQIKVWKKVFSKQADQKTSKDLFSFAPPVRWYVVLLPSPPLSRLYRIGYGINL